MPNRIHLTDLAVQKLRDPGTYIDQSLRAFAVRVGKNTKTFIVIKDGGHRIKIGRYPATTLHDARTAAKRILLSTPAETPAVTFREASRLYLDTTIKPNYRPRSGNEVERLLNRCSPLNNRPLPDISTGECTKLLDSIKAKSEANHTYSILRTFFRWCERRNLVPFSPLQKLAKPHKERSRERTLTDQELKAIWQAAPGNNFGKIVKLLILTGQRRSEIAGLRSSWVSADRITFPRHIVKNDTEHAIPLTAYTRSLLPQVPHDALLFPSHKTGAVITGWANLKEQLDTAAGVTGWTLHDLRRTFSTIHARIGTPPHITELLLNHKTSQTMTPISKVYTRQSFRPLRAAQFRSRTQT